MKKGMISLCLLLSAVLLCCACGKKADESRQTTEEQSSFQRSTEHEESGSKMPEEGGSVPASPAEDAPEEDPWAEGYFYDEALTEALWKAFATENTNNTEESSPSRTMTRDFLEKLNAEAAKWLYEGIPDEEAEQKLLAMSFRFPSDPADTARGLRSVRAAVYGLKGRDAETLSARILLGNTEPCFYLFLRAYYAPDQDRVRVYMINGLLW